eukprot:TRINITY_DN2592_c0_g1_i5.p1 TRINITY_DN2592_c0_g1~~TRINITY_DN2592_c0_g1_i5.p1  ORF type:complete len:424 (-),score=50.16 TRINITY_DN2592_c0_g1_i5:278-1492(-)
MNLPLILARLFLLTLMVAHLTSCEAISDWYPGIATHYQGPQDLGGNLYDPKVPAGSCGYGELDPKLYPFWGVAQLSSFSPMIEGETISGCGACFEVQCLDAERCVRQNSTTVMITDSCQSGCVQQQLNMHVFAFQHLAPSKWGEIPIRFRRVSCQPPAGMMVRVTDYRASEGGWIRLVIMEVAGKADIAAVDIRQHGALTSQWQPLNNSYGAAWETSEIPLPPFDIRVTTGDRESAILGNVITEVRVPGSYESQAQFYSLPLPAQPSSTKEVQGSEVFDTEVAMFPVFSMPPMDGSMSEAQRNASPYPLEAIKASPAPALSNPVSRQENKPQVSLGQLLNPRISLSAGDDAPSTSFMNNEETEELDENGMPDEGFQMSNSTDWIYLQQAFERLGWITSDPDSNV